MLGCSCKPKHIINQRKQQLLFDADRYTQLHWLGPQCSYSYSAATWPTATATTQLLGLHMPKPQVQLLDSYYLKKSKCAQSGKVQTLFEKIKMCPMGHLDTI